MRCPRCGSVVFEEPQIGGEIDRVCLMGHSYYTDKELRDRDRYLAQRGTVQRVRQPSRMGVRL